MKKFVSVLFSIISVVCIAFTFVGCGNNQTDEEPTEPDGKLYTLNNVVREGWIDKFDLKSIACGYYEWRNIEENPYAGLYEEPTEVLSEETENKIKEAYFGNSERIKILKYYGNYDGNLVVTLGYEDVDYDGEEKTDMTVGGVTFPELRLYPIYVYHYPEKVDPSIKVTGRMYGLEMAYEIGLLGENDLKSIACCVNERDDSIENPYSGMYEAPAQKLSKETKTELKQAYLKQIDKSSDDVLDGIIIHTYYGTYNGKIVVSMSGNKCAIGATTEGTEIGGVIFNNYSWRSIYVYHK